jgi:hypothetical protein
MILTLVTSRIINREPAAIAEPHGDVRPVGRSIDIEHRVFGRVHPPLDEPAGVTGLDAVAEHPVQVPAVAGEEHTLGRIGTVDMARHLCSLALELPDPGRAVAALAPQPRPVAIEAEAPHAVVVFHPEASAGRRKLVNRHAPFRARDGERLVLGMEREIDVPRLLEDQPPRVDVKEVQLVGRSLQEGEVLTARAVGEVGHRTTAKAQGHG